MKDDSPDLRVALRGFVPTMALRSVESVPGFDLEHGILRSHSLHKREKAVARKVKLDLLAIVENGKRNLITVSARVIRLFDYFSIVEQFLSTQPPDFKLLVSTIPGNNYGEHHTVQRLVKSGVTWGSGIHLGSFLGARGAARHDQPTAT